MFLKNVTLFTSPYEPIQHIAPPLPPLDVYVETPVRLSYVCLPVTSLYSKVQSSISNSFPLTYNAPADLAAEFSSNVVFMIDAFLAPVAKSTAPPFKPASFEMNFECLIVIFSQFSVVFPVKKIAPPRYVAPLSVKVDFSIIPLEPIQHMAPPSPPVML